MDRLPYIAKVVMVLCLLAIVRDVECLGMNWGTQATHKLPAKTVVQMLKDNGIQKVKLFDADSSTLGALSGSGIEVMVAIPNVQLEDMNSYNKARTWVKKSVRNYNFTGGVNIKSVSLPFPFPLLSSFIICM